MTGAVSRNRWAIFCSAESIFMNNFSSGFVDAHPPLDGCATPRSERPRPAEDMAPHRGFRANAGRADVVPSLAAVQSLLPPPKYVVVAPIRVRSTGVDGFGTLSSMTDSAPGLETPRCRVIPRSLLLSARCSRCVAAVPWVRVRFFARVAAILVFHDVLQNSRVPPTTLLRLAAS
jgi:hypothetical protein